MCKIDKILMVSDKQVVIYYTDRNCITVHSDVGGALNLALYVLGLEERVMLADDTTQVIELPNAA